MKTLIALLIAATAAVAAVPAADAAPRKLPGLNAATANLQLVSIRHARLKLFIRARNYTR